LRPAKEIALKAVSAFSHSSYGMLCHGSGNSLSFLHTLKWCTLLRQIRFGVGLVNAFSPSGVPDLLPQKF
jgi:hypothetical protein